MKKEIPILSWVLFALMLLQPVGGTVCACFGYDFELAWPAAFAVITALAAVGVVVLSVREKTPVVSGVVSVLLALAAPISLINAAFFLFKYGTVWVAVSMAVCVVCCYYLTVTYGKPLFVRITALVLSALMALPIGFLGFLVVMFGSIGQTTVVRTVESPNGVYYAEVIDSDQGALGGDTLVKVYKNGGFNALLFKIIKKPQTVYIGEWGEFEFMEIYWKDDSCLVIYSKEYIIE